MPSSAQASTSEDTTATHRRIFLWSHPRTVSNLFRRMIDPDVKQCAYNLAMPLTFGPDRMDFPSMSEKWTSIKESLVPIFKDKSMQVVFDGLQVFIAQVEAEGKSVLVKEHVNSLTRIDVLIGSPEVVTKVEDRQLDLPADARMKIVDKSSSFTNPTILPDRFLRTFSPVFTIRHPARMIPSYLRAAKKSFDQTTTHLSFPLQTSYKWTALLYDWYKSQPDFEAGWPIIIDGDELVHNAEEIMERFCRMAGWDSSRLQYHWDSGVDPVEDTYRDMPKVARNWQDSFFGTIVGSTGVQKDNKILIEPKIEEKMVEWVAEFGEEDASAIAAAVEGGMADYNYLKQFSLKA